MTTKTITKATSRGQITLPKKWRDRFKHNQYLIKAGDFKLEIMPINEEELEWAGAETIFNADRDNDGKGIEAGEFLKMLRSIDSHGQNTKASRRIAKKRPRPN
ncbi:MAG: AbrB/MazE/SpoVT family DNA-binding domain-containing protein [Patescibacteria group bacterium]